MVFKSPPSSYWSGRYAKGTDRWTQTQDISALRNGLISELEPLLLPDREYRILDIGCGTLWLSLEVAKKFPKVTIVGIDFSRQAILSSYTALSEALKHHNSITFKDEDFFSYESNFLYDVIFDFGLFHLSLIHI